jgi:hypothetical protein
MKQLFFDLLDYEIPDDVALYAKIQIPDIASISSPTDVDEAIIAQGKLAANVNMILKAFAGLAPVELLLRNGGRNPLLKALVAASYEMIAEITSGRLSELLKALTQLNALASSLMGNILSQSNKIAFAVYRQQFIAHAQNSALEEQTASALQGVIDALQDVVEGNYSTVDEGLEALQSKIDSVMGGIGV